MKFEWRNNRDFFAGLVYIGTGALAMIMALDYPFGSALRMGPGYFPTVLGGIMIAFGIAVLLMGVKNNEKIKGNWSIRALIILPIDTLLVATKAMTAFLAALRAGDDARSLATQGVPFDEFNALIGATDQMALADRYREA